MITVTGPSGLPFGLNPDLIERVDVVPCTLITMSDGSRYAVSEDPATLTGLIRTFRASVIAMAHHLQVEAPAVRPRTLHAVPPPADPL